MTTPSCVTRTGATYDSGNVTRISSTISMVVSGWRNDRQIGVEALARVRLTFMATPLATTDDVALRWALASVRTWLDPKACPKGTCQIVTPDQAFELANNGEEVELRYLARSSTPRSVAFVGSEPDLVAVLTGHLSLAVTKVQSSGDKRQAKLWLEAIVAAFPAPIRA
jgi:hypothetical protein